MKTSIREQLEALDNPEFYKDEHKQVTAYRTSLHSELLLGDQLLEERALCCFLDFRQDKKMPLRQQSQALTRFLKQILKTICGIG